jgi:Lon protease-like protein
VADVRTIPVFPLPDVVFFPETVLPLHVFETRYRQMVKDALAADRMIAVALLRPGWEKHYAGNPEYYPVATAGRMDDVTTTKDGRFYFKLSGSSRVKLGHVIRDAPYRLVEAEDIPERTIDENDPAIRSAKLHLLASQLTLVRELTGSETQSIVLDERVSFVSAVNATCASLPAEAEIRQCLLELDDVLVRHRRVAEILDQLLKRVLDLKAGAGVGSRDVN